jgi:biotin transport system substrate-specific component
MSTSLAREDENGRVLKKRRKKNMTAIRAVFENNKISPLALFIGLASIAALAAAARIQVPMWPVPITLQTGVVLLLPCLLGTRGAMAVLAGYFAAGAMGLPVFAGPSSPAYFLGPTGGYLLGFAAAALAVGTIYERRGDWSFVKLCALMLAGHALILALGAAWLAYGATALGIEKAFASGILPFLSGSIMKSLLVASCVKGLIDR